MFRLVFTTFMVVFPLAVASRAAEPTPAELFDQRIMPIFRSPNPSSCVQCHLAAVDLKNYILPSHEATFASLRDQGLIDLEAPRKSKILTLIEMGEKDLDEGAKLIHEKTRRAEYEAFAGWIEACCHDPRLPALPPLADPERARPTKPDEVIRHARKSRVLDSFARNVWSQRMRCFPCHTPYEIDESNARQQAAVKKHRELEEQYPELVERMKIFRETPAETLQYLIDASKETPDGELPLINLEDPSQSLIVLKPLSKLPRKTAGGGFEPPSYADPVTHMGGLKMHRDDQSYKAFMAWIQDYADVVGDRYASVDELPSDNWHASKLVLRLTNAPSSWSPGTPVQLFLHARRGDAWGERPVAFTQGTVTPRGMVNGALFLLATDDSGAPPARETASLPRGDYLVKVYVDSAGRVAKDPAVLLGPEEFMGQAELRRARWREGFRRAEKISAKSLTKGPALPDASGTTSGSG